MGAFDLSLARVKGAYNSKLAICVYRVAIFIRRHCVSSRLSEVEYAYLWQLDLKVCEQKGIASYCLGPWSKPC